MIPRSMHTKHDETPMKEVAVLGAGKGFGELALISNKKRAATIKTKSPCYFAILDKKDYQSIYGTFERKKLNRKISFLKTIPVFASKQRCDLGLSFVVLGITKDQLAKITYFLTEVKVERNQCLIREGEDCTH